MKLQIVQTEITNNFEDPRLVEKISSLWEDNMELVQEEFMNGNDLYIIYHNYDNNYMGDYHISLAKGDSIGTHDTDTQNWKTYSLKDKNEILECWKEIWQQDSVLNRLYNFDLEIYHADGTCTIMIGV